MSRVHPLIEQLTRARTKRGISLQALANRLVVTKDTVWNWENGKHDPRLGSIIAYANALGYELVLAPKKRGT